jgi:hypothetical protein
METNDHSAIEISKNNPFSPATAAPEIGFDFAWTTGPAEIAAAAIAALFMNVLLFCIIFIFYSNL